MALIDNALTNLARTKIFLGITSTSYDTLLTTLINSATEFVERYCDRRFKQTTYTNEVYDGTGTDEMLLKNYPVTTFTSLQERDNIENINSWTSLDSEDYFVKLNQGIIIYVGAIDINWQPYDYSQKGVFSKYPQHYRTTYIAGYNFDAKNGTSFLEDINMGDLEYAVWKLIATFYNNRKGSNNIQSESIGEYSVTFRKEVAMDEEIKQILEQYRRPTFGL